MEKNGFTSKSIAFQQANKLLEFEFVEKQTIIISLKIIDSKERYIMSPNKEQLKEINLFIEEILQII